MYETGHWKLVYPPGTERSVRRTSRNASVFLVIGDQEIKLPAVTGITLATKLDDVDRITLDVIGTVEVVYAEQEENGAEVKVAVQVERDKFAEMAALIQAVQDEGRADT
jgi:hypothetical protein